ncbi:MAG: alanine--tRNA ligase [Acidobacteriota bacterium]
MSLSSNEIRQTFLDYFKRRKHTIVSSSSLIPAGDPTLLFTNAGMVQFKDVFLGREKRAYARATTSQKCMRVSGKHNDLENVGPSPRHHTFFEMLGNFSFGDYFKRDAIKYAYGLLTEAYGISPKKLYFTVFQDDDEAFDIWVNQVGVPEDRVYRMGEKTNFWSMGDTGPCGPTSELHYDWGAEYCTCGEPNCSVLLDNGCERWLEVWNLVFMQFDQAADGTRTPLPKTGVDTGMGLERITSILQKKRSNYETDLFKPVLERTRKLLKQDKETMEKNITGYRVIADHARAVTFLIADGMVPGNEGRNYVLRLILRRAARYGQMIGFEGPFLTEIIPTVIERMGDAYPELVKRREAILKTTLAEEERFQSTLRTGSALLDELIEDLKARGAKEISGEDAFRLHDTYGFPLDLTRDVARDYGMTVDEPGFRRAMEEQSNRSRAASTMGMAEGADEKAYREIKEQLIANGKLPASGVAHDPYSGTEIETTVAGILRDGRLVDAVKVGDKVEVILPATCFYVESGGQVSDVGRLVRYEGEATRAELEDPGVVWAIEVTDMKKPVPGLVVHVGEVLKGAPKTGDTTSAEVEELRRWDIMRNHTATHLLHSELRYVLGEHVQQAGSLVAPDRFRFDFSHSGMLTQDELDLIEQSVNDAILANYPVNPTEMAYKEAVASGAMALFTEKYGERVRVIRIGWPENPFSQELCGGTHVMNTSQIGSFHVLSESSIGAGLRRIEAVTGRGVTAFMQEGLAHLQRAAAYLRTSPDQLDHKVLALMNENDAQKKEIERLRRELSQREAEQLLQHVQHVDGVNVLAAQVQAANADVLREMTDWFKDKLGSGIVVLGAAIEGKPSLVAAVTPDLVSKGYDAVKLIRPVAQVVGGGGGGRPALAQAGGKDVSRLAEALGLVPRIVSNRNA